MATEEAPVKVSDSSEGLGADKRSVNSNVSLSLQGVGMTDHQRLEGYKARRLDVRELGSVRTNKYLPEMRLNSSLCTCKSTLTSSICGTFYCLISIWGGYLYLFL